MSKQAFKRVRKSLKMDVSRKPLDSFAWPGGYPIYYVFSDGGCICPKCANANIDDIDNAIRETRNARHNSHGGWAIYGYDVNWESDLACDHCGKPIESAYDVCNETVQLIREE